MRVAHVTRYGNKVKESKPRCSRRVRRRVAGYVGNRMLKLPGRRRKGRQEGRFMDVARADMQEVGVTEDAENGCRGQKIKAYDLPWLQVEEIA